MTDFDLDFVRQQFPAFADPEMAGWAFFENAAGSFPCAQVLARLEHFYRHTKVQPYAPYPLAEAAGAAMDEAKMRLAGCLNIGLDELHIGPSTSQNTYVLAQAVAETFDGGEIVVTDQDHEANSGVWRRLAARGFTIREWHVDSETGHLDPAALAGLLSERTRVVAFPHASNIVAEINPVAEICEAVRQCGAVSVVDGVSYAPHGLPDVEGLGADIYLFSTYKTFGPHQGIMAVRRAVCERLANQGHWFNASTPTARLTPAGPDHAQIAALGGMVDYLEAFADRHGIAGTLTERARAVHARWRAREAELAAPMLEMVAARNDIRLIGPSDPDRRAPTVALAHDRPGEDLAADLAGHRIMTCGGAFYADRCVKAIGVDPAHGVLRLSFLHYTAPEEVAQAMDALDRVL